MVRLAFRGQKIQDIIESFIRSYQESPVSFSVLEDSYCLTFTVRPLNKQACGIEITVGLTGDEHLTILIGEGIVYEEYEGMVIPDDKVFITSLLSSVSKGDVQEKFIKVRGRTVVCEAWVKVDGRNDLIIKKNSFFCDCAKKATVINYQPW